MVNYFFIFDLRTKVLVELSVLILYFIWSADANTTFIFGLS